MDSYTNVFTAKNAKLIKVIRYVEEEIPEEKIPFYTTLRAVVEAQKRISLAKHACKKNNSAENIAELKSAKEGLIAAELTFDKAVSVS